MNNSKNKLTVLDQIATPDKVRKKIIKNPTSERPVLI